MIPTTPEVRSARHRLDGVLQSLVCRRQGVSPRGHDSDDDASATSGGGGGGGAGGSHAGESKERRPPRKRRRKDDDDDAEGAGSYHHTYVMKLFDRSVDLAQFSESTSLYPIARAWIQNQPHGKGARAGKNRGGKGTEEGVDGVEAGKAGGDVYRLPPPTPPIFGTEGSGRVPERLSWPKEEFFIHSGSSDSPVEQNAVVPPSQEQLLASHLGRWGAIRQQWKRQSAVNEARYADSVTIIKNMFEESQASLG